MTTTNYTAPHSLITMLFKNDEGSWCIATYKGGSYPVTYFPSAAAAKRFCKSRNMGCKRVTECDER